jgi:AcrR family transcriptional regulator
MGLRDQKRARQREAIIDAAMDFFAQQGFEATRVQDIARTLEISEATFFNYFPTKQAVLDAGVARHVEVIIAAMRELTPGPSVLDRVAELLRQSAGIMVAEPRFAALVALHLQLILAQGRQHEIYELLGRLLEEGQRRGEIRRDISAPRLAEALIASVLATMSNSFLAPETDATSDQFGAHLHERIEETWAIFCTGIVPQSESAPTRRRPQRQTSNS